MRTRAWVLVLLSLVCRRPWSLCLARPDPCPPSHAPPCPAPSPMCMGILLHEMIHIWDETTWKPVEPSWAHGGHGVHWKAKTEQVRGRGRVPRKVPHGRGFQGHWGVLGLLRAIGRIRSDVQAKKQQQNHIMANTHTVRNRAAPWTEQNK